MADPASLVEDSPCFLSTARISDLLRALPGYGPLKVDRVLSALSHQPVADLTPGQRKGLVEALKR
jgi:hypothetical protein